MTLEACSTVLVGIASLGAVAGIWAGNRTAYALLASALFSTALCEAGVPFRPSLWLAIDICVILWIIVGWADSVLQHGYGKQRDVLILALFVAIWPLYFIETPWRAMVIDIAVALQMLATFPVRRAWAWFTSRVAPLVGKGVRRDERTYAWAVA